MAVDIENIGAEFCEPVAGASPTLYWGLHSDFETILDPKDICDDNGNGAINFSELAVITGDHVLKAGKKLNKITAVVETVGLATAQIGEKGRRLFENTATYEIAGSYAKLLGFSRFIRNQNLVFFIEEFGSGKIRQIGSSRLPAYVETQEAGLEAAIEGKNAITITIKDKQKWHSPIYEGELLTYVDSE